jgi:hypothetical protein
MSNNIPNVIYVITEDGDSEIVCECCWKRFKGMQFEIEEVFMCEECYLYNTEE